MTRRIPEFRCIVTLKNNLLVERREALGLTSAQVADKCGVQRSRYSGFETMRLKPYGRRGEWRKDALLVASFYGCQPEDLWPDVVLAVERASMQIPITAAQALELSGVHPNPEQALEMSEVREGLMHALETLTEREREMVKRRVLNGEEYGEIGQDFCIGRARVQQIVQGALCKLRRRLESMEER